MHPVKILLVSAGLSAAALAYAGGHYNYGSPQGFNTPDMGSVAAVKKNAYDDQWVTIRGRLVNYLGHERYEFTDGSATIEVELDDDQNWSHVRKNDLIELHGKVDRDFLSTTIEVSHIIPLEGPGAQQGAAGFGGQWQPGYAQPVPAAAPASAAPAAPAQAPVPAGAPAPAR